MNRQFSFPYNGEDVDVYLKRLERYFSYIHDVYLGTPVAEDFFSQAIRFHNPQYYDKCHEFLKTVKDTKLKTVIVLNGNYDNIPLSKRKEFINAVFDYIKEMNIYGVVCSDFIIAERLHLEFPELEINTSCNCPHYEINHLNIWRRLAGVSLVNPPRDTSRNFSYLKKLKEAGYRIKLLINETCYLSCPFISSFCNVSQEKRLCIRYHPRIINDALNPFKLCIIFPNWLKKYDEVVDIYKISGRFSSTDYIFNLLDIFAKYPERSCYMTDLIEKFPEDMKIKTDNIPLYISDCDKNCNDCRMCDSLFRLKIKEANSSKI